MDDLDKTWRDARASWMAALNDRTRAERELMDAVAAHRATARHVMGVEMTPEKATADLLERQPQLYDAFGAATQAALKAEVAFRKIEIERIARGDLVALAIEAADQDDYVPSELLLALAAALAERKE